MAGPNLPTNIASGGTTTGHKNHTDTVHTYVDKLDTTYLTPASGKVLTGNGTTWAPADPAVDSSLIGRVAALELPGRNAQTGTTYTVVSGDAGTLIEMNNTGLNTVTLPTLPAGTTLGFLQYGPGPTRIQGSGVTLHSRDGAVIMAGRYALASAYYRTSTEVILGGDLLAITPADVADLGLWYKASSLSGLADGTAIDANWSSSVGTSSATQATSGFRPTKQTVSGSTVVRFDGTDDFLNIGGDALTVTQDTPGVTIFARMRLISAPGSGSAGIVVFSIGTASGTSRLLLQVTGGNWSMLGRRNDADSSGSTGTTAYETTSVHTVCMVADYANTGAFMYIDGVAAGSNTSFLTAGNTSDTPSLAARIGAQLGGFFINMDLRELAVYSSALSTSNRQLVESYYAGI